MPLGRERPMIPELGFKHVIDKGRRKKCKRYRTQRCRKRLRIRKMQTGLTKAQKRF